MTAFDIDRVRDEFPALALTDGSHPRIYLDNPAGTQVPRRVAEAVSRCLIETNANLGGFFATTRAAEAVVGEAHAAMADFLGARTPEEIVIGPNMTTLTYHMSRTIGRDWRPGDEIVVTRMDHEGNISPWLQLAEDRGLTVRWMPFGVQSWRVEPAALEAALTERTRLVALNYASNLTGSINDAKALTALAKRAGALVYVDAVQLAPHRLVDVEAIGCDFLVCSAYKFFGPHLGILWGRREAIAGLRPYKCRCSSDALPERFELGTPQIELLAGLAATVAHFEELGASLGQGGSRRAKIAAAYRAAVAHESGLERRLLAGLAAIEGVRIHGIAAPKGPDERVPTVSFTVEDIGSAAIAELLAEKNIFVWSGHNYAWEIVRQLGLPAEDGVVRIGIAHYNTAAEIEETLEAVGAIIGMLRQHR